MWGVINFCLSNQSIMIALMTVLIFILIRMWTRRNEKPIRKKIESGEDGIYQKKTVKHITIDETEKVDMQSYFEILISAFLASLLSGLFVSKDCDKEKSSNNREKEDDREKDDNRGDYDREERRRMDNVMSDIRRDDREASGRSYNNLKEMLRSA